ncbi:hypothetical protein [Streptomyces sp. NBC_00986]|nr:hypothetical protein OG504_11310 [Streptomyces sp. NBC_00986]
MPGQRAQPLEVRGVESVVGRDELLALALVLVGVAVVAGQVVQEVAAME